MPHTSPPQPMTGLWQRIARRRSSPVGGCPGEPTDLRLRFRGRSLRLHIRRDTSDEGLARMIVRDGGEYALPPVVRPRVIVDVGANIGMTAVYYACAYPQARIVCFEPLPANLELLRANAAPFGDRITVVPTALGDATGRFTYRMSDDPANFGGGGFTERGTAADRTLELPVRRAADALADAGLDRVDVFKLDTEGSEAPIVSALPETIRQHAQAYIGELHGCPGDFGMLELLQPTHALGFQKRPQRRCYPFLALRRDLAGPLP